MVSDVYNIRCYWSCKSLALKSGTVNRGVATEGMKSRLERPNPDQREGTSWTREETHRGTSWLVQGKMGTSWTGGRAWEGTLAVLVTSYPWQQWDRTEAAGSRLSPPQTRRRKHPALIVRRRAGHLCLETERENSADSYFTKTHSVPISGALWSLWWERERGRNQGGLSDLASPSFWLCQSTRSWFRSQIS